MFDQINDRPRRNWHIWVVFAVLIITILASVIWVLRMTQMPLKSYRGPLPPLTHEESEMADHLSQHITYLAETIGERNMSREGTLRAATEYFQSQLKQAGYSAREQTYMVEGRPVSNLEARLPGSDAAGETVVIGAHYDSVTGSPGANDNGSGAAAVLELARIWQGSTHRRPIRLVLFVNEEPPFFQTPDMGSVVYARQLRSEHVSVTAMISLETIGFYSDDSGSQKYPALLGLFYPDRGNFIGFVGNPESRALLRNAIRRFRETTKFPSEGLAAPADWPGVGWSDHWSFWQEQYPAIMITDTAPFRYPYYHTPLDTANHIDFQKMARVVQGVRRVVESLATE